WGATEEDHGQGEAAEDRSRYRRRDVIMKCRQAVAKSSVLAEPTIDLAKAVGKLAPDAMVMGSTRMSMGSMEMPAPDNTLPMMTGTGQFGPIEMGGMFTVMKIREGLARDDYRDPGPYQFPQGTVAYEVTPPAPEPARQQGTPMKKMKM